MLKFTIALAVLIVGLLAFATLRSRKPVLAPPGPPALPFIGNLHQIPSKDPWRTFYKWHQDYGPIVSFKTGQTLTIILGSHKAAKDLLEKQSRISSSRPHLIFVGDIIYGGLQTALLPYGPQWRIHRRIHAAFTNVISSQKYRLLQDIESKQLLQETLSSGDFSRNFRRYSASVLFTLTYGKRMRTFDEPEIRQIMEIMDVVLSEASRSSLLDAFPVLDRLPDVLAPWRLRGRRLFEKHTQLFADFMEQALATDSWNFCKEAVQMKASTEIDRQELSFVLGSLFEASHTSALILEVFVLASILNPNAVALAQEELDRVVGPNRVPCFEDMGHLPYVGAFIREVMRWRPATPGGMPHTVIDNIEYMDYRIPKGATVVANHWSLDFDPVTFKDPYTFEPQRWLQDPSLPQVTFGFGRRVCPGRHIGLNSLFIVMSRFLWAYDIGFAYENGIRQEIDPWDMTQTSDSGPMPFKASFRCRNAKHRQIIDSEYVTSITDTDTILAHIGSNSM